MIIADMNRDWAKFKFVGVKVKYIRGSRSFGSKVKCKFFEILSMMIIAALCNGTESNMPTHYNV